MPKLGGNMPEKGNLMPARPTRSTANSAHVDAPTRIADALFTTTQQRVLALLFGHPSRSFFASQLIAQTGSGSGAVQRELKRLASSGLVSVTRIGKQKHYKANPDCPVFEELCALTRKTMAIVDPIQEALEPIADRIELALLYGSIAKGSETAKSDVDLLIVADDLTLEALYTVFAPVEVRLAREISPVLYTPQEFATRRAAGNAFLTRVLEGEHLALVGDANGKA